MYRKVRRHIKIRYDDPIRRKINFDDITDTDDEPILVSERILRPKKKPTDNAAASSDVHREPLPPVPRIQFRTQPIKPSIFSRYFGNKVTGERHQPLPPRSRTIKKVVRKRRQVVKSVICDRCGKKLSGPKVVQSHQASKKCKNRAKPTEHKCLECNRVFDTEHNLHNHQKARHQ